MKTNSWLKLSFFVLAVPACAALALLCGSTGIPDRDILLQVRLPRVFLALLTGAALAGSGTVMQGVLRNPLADPYILGTSAGAAVGMTLALISGIPYNSGLFYIFTAGGAFLATAAAYFVAHGQGKTTPSSLILSGVIINTFLGAFILLFFTIYRNESFSVLYFMMGSVTEGSREVRLYSFVLFALGAVLAWAPARTVDAMSMGEEKAVTMGIDPERFKITAFAASALMTAAAVSASGIIGFTGLIVPHAVRIIVGPSHKTLFPCTLLAGAAFMALMDALGRCLMPPTEIPVGILTALCGAPFFLYILRKNREYRF
ncbi:MAG: iron ABC transporter permease [Elusimicrobiaceae bacterium]|jgi:iron complex transport system permease protein